MEHDLQTSFKDGLFFIRKEFGRDYLLSENCKKKISVVIIQSELSIQNQKKILGINILNII